MIRLIVILMVITGMVACGSDSKDSKPAQLAPTTEAPQEIHNTPIFVAPASLQTLSDNHVAVITETGGKNQLHLLESTLGEIHQIATPTHDAYKILMALISADRNYIIYIANQDFKEKNDLYIADSSGSNTGKLSSFPATESVELVETTDNPNELLVKTKNLKDKLDNFYLINLINFSQKKIIASVDTLNHFLSPDNSKLYIMEKNPKSIWDLNEIDTIQKTKRLVLSDYKKEDGRVKSANITFRFKPIFWIDNKNLVLQHFQYGVIVAINISNGEEILIDEHSRLIPSSDPKKIIYNRIDAFNNDKEGFVSYNYDTKSKSLIKHIPTSSLSFQFPPIERDNNIFYSKVFEGKNKTNHYIYDISNNQTSEIATIPEDIFFYIASVNTRFAKIASYSFQGKSLYLTDVAKRITETVALPFQPTGIAGSFSESGNNFITASQGTNNDIILNINMANKSLIQHELTEPGKVISICTAAGRYCHSKEPFNLVPPQAPDV